MWRIKIMSLRIKVVVDKFVEELKQALDADIQDRIMKEREMQSYIEEREREVAEREAAWKAELSRREVIYTWNVRVLRNVLILWLIDCRRRSLDRKRGWRWRERIWRRRRAFSWGLPRTRIIKTALSRLLWAVRSIAAFDSPRPRNERTKSLYSVSCLGFVWLLYLWRTF